MFHSLIVIKAYPLATLWQRSVNSIYYNKTNWYLASIFLGWKFMIISDSPSMNDFDLIVQ